jgi:hypothetical protein
MTGSGTALRCRTLCRPPDEIKTLQCLICRAARVEAAGDLCKDPVNHGVDRFVQLKGRSGAKSFRKGGKLSGTGSTAVLAAGVNPANDLPDTGQGNNENRKARPCGT